MKSSLPLVLTAALGGCAGFTAGGTPLEVQEVARSLYCNSTGEQAAATLLPDPAAVRDWQTVHGITLAGTEALAPATYVMVEMGTRPTGGYGIAVARAAELHGEALTLQATFVSPASGAIVTQAVSSPCVLVRLPPGRYRSVAVKDGTGAVRTQGRAAPPPPAQ